MLLTACASSAPAVQGDEGPWEAVDSWEEAREDASCVVPLCEEEHCVLWRCRDLELADAPSILLTRGTLTLRPPASPTRWWGRPLVAPFDSDPVFEIPWHDWLHSGGPRGGQWNDAWRQFREEHPDANQVEMWRFAFELMDRLGVNGPLVAYYCQDR
ncbi:DUF2380 domain-containing protein [Cystobacter fuscus]|nr:DUF2380 domain-containing protein [Cystobacter fuscus]